MDPMARYDLHSHSTISDGLLSPAAVATRAAARGVAYYALTDHDEVGGLAEARTAATEAGITFVPGSELSVSWEAITVHVVALQIDPADSDLAAGLASIRSGRTERARKMGKSLASAGIPDAFEGAMRYVTSERLISRTHFARFLVDSGRVGSVKDVFKRYLVRGKPGYVEHRWATLEQAIGWIHGAGGQAVLAHPGRYKVDGAGLRRLITHFRDAGGDGIEVLSPSHTREQYTQFARFARSFGLLASCGSDYHGPGESHVDLGDLPELPAGVVPVWSKW
jgi:predicted metal-dependent phosphoesterase TrpH